LFVTTARHGRSDADLAQYPGAGCVWAMRVEVAGLPVNGFKVQTHKKLADLGIEPLPTRGVPITNELIDRLRDVEGI
jgi:hypothetical protein